uniref:Uncharacterized protein n=1 Tax=Capra hircus TaxID=9925 RepID=A0A8C2P4Z4_CAPHI
GVGGRRGGPGGPGAQLPQAGREDVHAALPPLRGEPAHGHHRRRLQAVVRTLWRAQRGLHQPRPRLRLHPPATCGLWLLLLDNTGPHFSSKKLSIGL